MLVKDKLERKSTNTIRKILGKMESVHKGKLKYILFFKYIDFLLKKDFDLLDNKFKTQEIKEINSTIPFRFWVMWWQGIDDAPQLVKNNVVALIKILGKENVTIIDKNNYKKYTNISNRIINKLNQGNISLTNWSDIVRFNLLKNNGGYWIDSTVIISTKFKTFLKQYESNTFFSLAAINPSYTNISQSQWRSWFMGSSAHFGLFEYGDMFYKLYFERHELIIDYFLVDDIICHYYKCNDKFRFICNKCQKSWKPYFWITHFDRKYSPKYINLFENNVEYSIQKLSYKFDKRILQNKKNFIYYIINNKM